MMRFPRSMFGQLLASQVALLVLLIVSLPVLILIGLHRTADDYVAERLRGDADTLAELRRVNHARAVEVLGPLYRRPWGSRAYRIVDASGAVVDTGGLPEAVPPFGQAEKRPFHHDGKLDVYRRGAVLNGRPVTILVAQDRTRPEVIVDDVVAAFLQRSLWIIPLILMASTIIGLMIVRRLTLQLRRASTDADLIDSSQLEIRIDAAALPLEVRGLASATNAALDRVAAGYRRQSDFVASVAHELRTPMALLTLRCDALPDSPDRDGLRAAIDQASHVVAQLMELAMIEGRPPTIDTVDVAAVAREAVETAAPIVYRSGRSIEVIESLNVAAVGNAGLLRIAVANLIDNAVRHTPPGTHIVVRVAEACIVVGDDGPGFSAEAEAARGGAGLGLSIVRRIMDAMGGRMDVRSDASGTAVALELDPING